MPKKPDSRPAPPKPASRRTPALPEYCTYQCPHSDFPPADTAGLCRTMAAVYCKKLRGLVHKNTPCAWRKSRLEAAGYRLQGKRKKP